MLKISIPEGADVASQHLLNQYGIPQPLSGTDTEINGDLILLFEDEAEAVAYLDGLEEFAGTIEDNSPAKNIIILIVSTINKVMWSKIVGSNSRKKY